MRAMTGLAASTIAPSSARIAVLAPVIGWLPASARSAPAQNTRPVWVITMARADGSAAASASRAESSATSWRDSALRLCGESRVRVATWSPAP